jgi:hypothetical protein
VPVHGAVPVPVHGAVPVPVHGAVPVPVHGAVHEAVAVSGLGVDIQLFTMQGNSYDFLDDWVQYHGTIFGFKKLTIVDTDSNNDIKKQLKRYRDELGVTVYFRNKNGFRFKVKHMTGSMRVPMDNGDKAFLIPLDIDEFIVAVRYDPVTKKNVFSMDKKLIMESFNQLPKGKYSGKKYKFNTFDAIDCEVDLLADSPPRSKRHHRTTSYLEETDTYTRCNAKTFYWSEGFMKTDDGNHYGEVLNETLKYCFQKKKCKKCYHKFMKAGLGLLHFSTLGMNYNEYKRKMLHHYSKLAHHGNFTTMEQCKKVRNNNHYCKFNAGVLEKGDMFMMQKIDRLRRKKCNQTNIIHQTAPSQLLSQQRWSDLL